MQKNGRKLRLISLRLNFHRDTLLSMKTLLIALALSSQCFAATNLLLVGGGARPKEAMSKFAELAGQKKSSILVIPWASASIEGAENIKSELSSYEFGKIEVASDSPDTLRKQIAEASGIFFTGGNQNNLMKRINDLNLKSTFKKMFESGVVFGGTSAGTAIMSNPMLNGEGDLGKIDGSQIGLAEGLGLLPESVIVDQHFIIRSRFNRLAGVILNQKSVTGLGVDEGTALLVSDNVGTVVGPSQVLVFKKTDANTLEITILSPHQKINLL